jgi:hypothetical protein
VAFTALGGPRLVRYLGLNLMDSLLGEGVVASRNLSLTSKPRPSHRVFSLDRITRISDEVTQTTVQQNILRAHASLGIWGSITASCTCGPTMKQHQQFTEQAAHTWPSSVSRLSGRRFPKTFDGSSSRSTCFHCSSRIGFVGPSP